MKLSIAILACLFCLLGGLHAQPQVNENSKAADNAHATHTVPAYLPPEPNKEVETVRLDWLDERRNREVPVKIYLPKAPSVPMPIIIFSHGLGGSREGYEYLGRHWAGCGYVSVHVQHLGSDDSIWKDVPLAERPQAIQKAAANLQNAQNRPPDVQFAIDQLERLNKDETSPLKGRLDLKSIAVAGHSFGGFTTLALAGQTFIRPLGVSKRIDEPRIKAAIQMSAPAPMLRRDLDRAYGSITIPVMHMTGTKDFIELLPQTTAADRRIPFDHMSRSETCLVIFKDGDHMVFSGREKSASLEKQDQDKKFQALICAGTTAFWDAYLKGNMAAKTWLLKGGYTKWLNEQATFEVKSPQPQTK